MWLLNIIINVMTGIVQVERRAGFQLLLGPGTSGVDVTCLFSVIDTKRVRAYARATVVVLRATSKPLEV